ncbi:MAG TPA: amidohydrolase/deacetylase family metallohydrolase [Bryobacteraceae bacterium]|nr:amidohydrolase/deacetylase family metallohydrolase [Bryobacteraceae bacterium]
MTQLTRLPGLLLFVTALAAQTRYDLLLKGGHVIDPANNVNALMDVAIAAGKIARVAAGIPAAEARQVVDARGLFVTPGLVDIHVHAYAGTGMKGAYSGDNSLYPDGYTFRSGVTTAVDAGGAGWRNFADFKDRVIDRAKTRVLAMLNIVGRGMGGGAIEQKPEDMDAAATAKAARQYPEIVAIKTAHYAAPEWVAVDRAIEAGKLAGLPVMVDFGTPFPNRTFEQLISDHLRPGDISTHMYQGLQPLVDDKGKTLPYLLSARKRGVKFDLGHGGGSFVWSEAVPAIRDGWVPDTISTDLHASSANAGMKDMVTTMSKVLSLGVPLADVIRMSTWSAALSIRRTDLGTLRPGAGADIALLRVDKGKFGYQDARGARLTASQKLVCEMTLRDGKVVWDLNGLAGEEWDTYYARPENRRTR